MNLPAPPSSDPDRAIVALLVDRDADARESCAEFLRQSGCDVEVTHDGRDALAKAFNRLPDVIVTSTQLTGMNAFDLCRVLRMDNVTSSIPIVALTRDASTESRRALSAGADAVLPKSSLPDALLAEIKALLARSRLLRTESRAIQATSEKLQSESDLLLQQVGKRVMLNHIHGRRMTNTPEIVPPYLLCPLCYRGLKYQKSYIGGVSAKHPEQWDYFECPTGCGEFQYRHRTRKLRHVD
jgi:DNA-binding response OmpR family regulator